MSPRSGEANLEFRVLATVFLELVSGLVCSNLDNGLCSKPRGSKNLGWLDICCACARSRFKNSIFLLLSVAYVVEV